MFKRLILLVLGGLALREAQKRGYLDKLSGSRAKWPFPTAATAGAGPDPTEAATNAGSSAPPR